VPGCSLDLDIGCSVGHRGFSQFLQENDQIVITFICLNLTAGHYSFYVSLRELNLRSCDNISDIGMAYLAEGGSRISSLDVSFCDKIGDQALVHVSQGLFNRRSLSLSACQVSDEGICRIARTLHDLETLNIGQCSRISDKGLQTIVSSPHTHTHTYIYIYMYVYIHVLTLQILLVNIRTVGSNSWPLPSAHTVLSVCSL
jgi:hypothetical protein